MTERQRAAAQERALAQLRRARAWSAAIPTGDYASKAERQMAEQLTLLAAAGVIAGWAYTGTSAYGDAYPLWAGEHDEIVGTYRPDFRVTPLVGPGYWVVEVKGRISRDFPLRRRLFEACYPDVPLHVVPSDRVRDYDPRTWKNGRRGK